MGLECVHLLDIETHSLPLPVTAANVADFEPSLSRHSLGVDGDLRFCESSISASLEVLGKYLYTIFLAAG
jgi:hypothetical protein